ncbi:MAG TPA: choice-of-anchor tandem repeat GloVer-containing protein [Terriglobales bacterium]
MSRHTALVSAEIAFVLLTLATCATAGDTYKVLHLFNGNDGANPEAGLIFDAFGNLYGTTAWGGAGGGEGTIFQLDLDPNGRWIEHVLYRFCQTGTCADGARPTGGLIFDSAGSLYGTTQVGGSAGQGTVFQLKRGSNGKWTEQVLYSFCQTDGCADGASPNAPLVFDEAGDLYGTTTGGGEYGAGTVFQLASDDGGNWREHVLYSFCALPGCADGEYPQAGVIIDNYGNLYGTTPYGGWDGGEACPNGGGTCGTVFELVRHESGKWREQVLHSFHHYDGAQPDTGLVFDGSGTLFGTTYWGGVYGSGVIFQLIPRADGVWMETVVHQFDTLVHPSGTPVFDVAGNLYGTVENTTSYEGAVFELSPGQDGAWTLAVLHAFSRNGARGADPQAGVILDPGGNVYGTTFTGGLCCGPYNGNGLVFEITP